MFPSRPSPLRHVLLLMVVITAVAFAKLGFAKEATQPPPKATHAKTYPAVDAHLDEKVAIAADPFDMADKTAFMQVPYKANDILPIRVIISNDSDAPLNLSQMVLQVNTVNPRAKLAPADVDDLQRRLARQTRRGDEQSRNPLPIPLPGRKMKPAVKKEWQDELEALRFKWIVVEPHSSVSGFFFFDVRDLEHPLAGGHLYVTGIRNENGRELLFFDIALEKYLTYRPEAR
ncbi:MAG: hypothetical protein M3P27_03805 [Acidobacteriota bacterium]|nr:hypothetical protein [Acidobacteriota bacterium]